MLSDEEGLVGGIGTYEGPILGALVFFTIETLFGAAGVTYLIGLGAVAVLFALVIPRGIWGTVERRLGVQLLPVGYRLLSDNKYLSGDGGK
jgi:branched-chain amino acid transport system permease protein